MTQEKHVEEKITERKVELTGDDQAPGTNNPQPAPETPSNNEHTTENSTQNQQDAVENKDE